eukprot:gnl/Trimastix_PCT/2508.p1 GENE.gnl/Trimastix_PCT/2508~~gnl/Trimastix_PCT/2508.p1  ORF type:complete len:268 (+),score=48.10 gnl/Trimastix_PCT/2508:45-848(+)
MEEPQLDSTGFSGDSSPPTEHTTKGSSQHILPNPEQPTSQPISPPASTTLSVPTEQPLPSSSMLPAPSSSASIQGFMETTQTSLKSRGLGWLLETNEEDFDNNGKTLLEELDIQPREILQKVKAIFFPFNIESDVFLSKSDFWGPLFIVILYALLIVWGQFRILRWVLLLWFVGSYIIYFLARVQGSKLNYSQTLSVIGYSLLPLVLTVLLCLFLGSVPPLALLARILGTAWSAYSAARAMTDAMASKRFLIVYPIFLLFTIFLTLS